MAMKVAKAGYYGGDIQKVLNSPCDLVFAIINYEAFESDYSNAYSELNKEQL
tara:strand:- start:3295 stop:3450 length:156 start_codon:yes stop_codon:yes gene_type:complete